MTGVELLLAFLSGVVMGIALDCWLLPSLVDVWIDGLRRQREPSATAYIDRDGTVVRAIDPTKYAAW